MTKLIPAIAFLLLGTAQVPALAAPVIVDLDAPGVLDTLARTNPVHYDKVQRIVAGVKSKSDSEVNEWLRVSFDAKDVRYAALLMVSYPPKRRLSFTLDDKSYKTVVTLDVQPKVTPAR
jgi:hypothetical protein